MLAILLVEMEWLKENRTSEGAIQRQEYYKPVKIEDEVILKGDGIFFKKCQYYQKGNVIQSASEISDKLDAKQKEENKGSPFSGQPNVLNETAFLLDEGKSGLLKYNYRHISYHGQWYKCYYVYIVNTKVLTQDVFIRNYDYEYNQLADLF